MQTIARLKSVCKSLESQTEAISDASVYVSKSHKSDSCKSAPLIFKSFTDCNQCLSSSTDGAVKATSEFQLALNKIQLHRSLVFSLTRGPNTGCMDIICPTIQATILLLNKTTFANKCQSLSIIESNPSILSSVILSLPHSMSQSSLIQVRFCSRSHKHFFSAIKNPNSD
jgi:hypothetical protein